MHTPNTTQTSRATSPFLPVSPESASPVLEGLDARVDYWINSKKAQKSAQYYLDRVLATSPDRTTGSLLKLQKSAEQHLGLRPYPVQSAAALALIEGSIVEMATGEGKTLTLAMAASALALSGHQVHILTANDYLAERDANDMSALYSPEQLSCAAVTGKMDQQQSRLAYQSAIVYTTAKELLADYLRDNLAEERHANTYPKPANGSTDRLIKSLTHVLLDEADHLLIDEAQTPLVISEECAQDPRFVLLYRNVFSEIGCLKEGRDYQLNRQLQSVNLKASAVSAIADRLHHKDAVFQNHSWLYSLVKRAIAIDKFLILGQHYLIEDDSIKLIDESTGRVMPNRSFGQGRHTLVEIKEGVSISPQQRSVRHMGFQRFFRSLPFLSGMTGTAWENRAEFWQIYQLPVVVMPTHQPSQRLYLPAELYVTSTQKWQAIGDKAQQIHQEHGALLIGTNNVVESEHCAQKLAELSLPYSLLNASQNQQEAEIVAKAGTKGSITIATNMAGRGTDIKLDDQVQSSGGLTVISAQWSASKRVDRQLFGRCARQGDFGRVITTGSLEDSIFKRYLSRIELKIARLLLAKNLYRSMVQKYVVWRCQRTAEKLAKKQRINLFKQEQWKSDSFFTES